MKIFLDCADCVELNKYVEMGIVDGITTNPTLLSRTKDKNIKFLLDEICDIMKGRDVSIEVTETEPKKIFEQACKISEIAENVVVKIPCFPQYFSVMEKLIQKGIRINVTLVFSPLQALAVAKLNVDYISVFVGRLEEIGIDGMNIAQEVQMMLSEYDFSSKLLIASVRSVEHVRMAALFGADVITIPVNIFEKLFDHPLTTKGAEIFLEDWKKSGLILNLN